jgi:hypothetical protein
LSSLHLPTSNAYLTPCIATWRDGGSHNKGCDAPAAAAAPAARRYASHLVDELDGALHRQQRDGRDLTPREHALVLRDSLLDLSVGLDGGTDDRDEQAVRLAPRRHLPLDAVVQPAAQMQAGVFQSRMQRYKRQDTHKKDGVTTDDVTIDG